VGHGSAATSTGVAPKVADTEAWKRKAIEMRETQLTKNKEYCDSNLLIIRGNYQNKRGLFCYSNRNKYEKSVLSSCFDHPEWMRAASLDKAYVALYQKLTESYSNTLDR
jgi:hypothetical protein